MGTAAVMACLILLALISVVQVTHLHQNASEASHCALCIVMHSAAPIAVAATVVVLVQMGVSKPLQKVQIPVLPWQARYSTRPPPQSR